jgi:signal transduction histidine kinase
MSGVTTHVDYGGTVRLATSLQPGLKHLYYIDSDPSSLDIKTPALRAEFAPFAKQLDIVIWEGLDLDDLLRRVETLPPHSAVLFDSYLKDPTGNNYIPVEVCARIARRANAPVYTVYQTMVGKGPVGGVVVNFEAIGRQGAQIVLALLAGAPVSRYPVEWSKTDVMIDWRKLEQFGFSEGSLPSSAIILFRPPTLWERYRWYLIAGGVVILLQTILIIELVFAGKLRKKSERSARELASRLINAQEEERRRIAGELHDDVSQRLALVAIHLDTLRGSPPASRGDLIGELSVLFDETDLISSDIHQFSHELHPAVLERLGLSSALRRHCAEFSAHRKIAVDMSTIGGEPRMDPKTALAFFRIGQECLMNAAKHSGAKDCKVSLTYARDRITLAVEDNGSGFDPKRIHALAGLGIQSMRERLRSIGGRLRIQSSALHGTTVFAEAGLTPEAKPHVSQTAREEAAASRSAASAF